MLQTVPFVLDRLPDRGVTHPEQKDPSIINTDARDKEVSYKHMMYLSSGMSNGQRWEIGRFGADELSGVWHELESVTLADVTGPQLCAPAVAYEFENGKPHYTMYIQTACFEPGGVIMEATSTDGKDFIGKKKPLVTKDSVINPLHPIIGVYDPSYSQVSFHGQMYDCLTFTGITKINQNMPHKAEGDIYKMLRQRSPGAEWSPPKLSLAMADIPFHNQPGRSDQDYEWCPEGSQIIGLDDKHFLMIGVCFLPKPAGCNGQRQRVFLAGADSIDGPFLPMGIPFEPQSKKGENGHPDTVIDHQKQLLHVVLQERESDD